jgi:hypothetical protein
MADKCKRCGACKECGALPNHYVIHVNPQPHTYIWPQPNTTYYPNVSSSSSSSCGISATSATYNQRNPNG